MNIHYMILLSSFLFVNGGNVPSVGITTPPLDKHDGECDQHSHSPSQLPEHIKMRILKDRKIIARVDLEPRKRVLANKHLPVWFSRTIVDRESLYNENEHSLERDNEVMKQLGEFTTYHDVKTSSAAILFHKQHKLDGIIGYDLFIQQLSIDSNIYPIVEKSIVLDEDGVYSSLTYRGHLLLGKDYTGDPNAGVNYQQQLKTYGNRVYNGYPEVLVIVSTDVADDWIDGIDESERPAAIVSHVLTLFNAIDMLYSKLRRTNIQINLAGIIVEEEHTFKFLEDCYYFSDTEYRRLGYRLEGSCNNDLLRMYLYARRKEIPTDSYDMVIHLTRDNLYSVIEEPIDNNEVEVIDLPLVGISHLIPELFKSRSTEAESILIGTITYPDYFENYPTIAHEMAHLMTVKHDRTPFFTQDFSCCGHIMKTVGGYCERCFSWSDISEETFYLFFSSPNCCTFINEPRSLHPAGPREVLTADEQCQCYGYEHAKFDEPLENFCQSKLQCKGVKNTFHDVIFPMDGTPCGENKVCWTNHCEDTEIQKLLTALA